MREQRPHCVRTLQAGWHHSSGAPWSSFSTLSGCHVQGFACMCSSHASLNSCEEKRDRFKSPVQDLGAWFVAEIIPSEVGAVLCCCRQRNGDPDQDLTTQE